VVGYDGKTINKHHIEGPTGVRGRNSDNRLIREKLGWSPSTVLSDGLRATYAWIHGQVMRNARTRSEALQNPPPATTAMNTRAAE
jgi:hypothetical protein